METQTRTGYLDRKRGRVILAALMDLQEDARAHGEAELADRIDDLVTDGPGTFESLEFSLALEAALPVTMRDEFWARVRDAMGDGGAA